MKLLKKINVYINYMKDKNINTILVLIIILLCYMYFTKKNCKKEIEGFSDDTILRRQTLVSEADDDEDGVKEGEEIVIQSSGEDEKVSQSFISQIIPFFMIIQSLKIMK